MSSESVVEKGPAAASMVNPAGRGRCLLREGGGGERGKEGEGGGGEGVRYLQWCVHLSLAVGDTHPAVYKQRQIMNNSLTLCLVN